MDLVLLACLIVEPTSCRQERLAMAYAPTTPMACMAAAPALLAEWSSENPELTVKRWTCAPAERDARRVGR